MRRFFHPSRLFMQLWLCAGFLVLAPSLRSQQLEIGNNHIFNPGWVNPGHVSIDNLYKVSLLYQHRNIADLGWKSTSQFLDFKSNGLGKKRAFGFGLNIGTDFEHTESKLSFNASFGAKLIQTELISASLGFNLGMVNWGSNYDDVPIYQQNDPLLSNANFTDLDAGLGLHIAIQSYVFRSSIDVWGRQIPGSFLSASPNMGAILSPHAYAAGKFLYNVGPDIFLGPMLLYRNIFTTDPRIGGIVAGQLDVGAKMELDRPRIWAGAAYRLINSAATVNFGMQILGTDTADGRKQIANFVDLTFSAAYPLSEKSVFGPSIEVGLALLFGSVGAEDNDNDTIGKMRGAFWVNNGNMDTHKERYLKVKEPAGLKAATTVEDASVYLDYEWDDVHYLYSGYNFANGPDSTIAKLGDDWIGMDQIIGKMVDEVVKEALNPVHMDVENPDSVEPLKELISLDIAARLKFDQNAAEFGAEGIVYNGELGYDYETVDSASLSIRVIYDSRDTVIVIPRGRLINNLELCALKMDALQRRLEFEFHNYYGGDFTFVNRDDLDRILALGARQKVLIGFPEIIPNNPNQEPFQVTMISMQFGRDQTWEPKIERKKGRQKRDADKATSKSSRNNYRDPVEGDEDN